MESIERLFGKLREQGKKALMPFVTAGDPSLDLTGELVRLFAAHGCALCEIGIPYSDPIADGPVIQASYTRALEGKVTLQEILSSVEGWNQQLAKDDTPMPLVSSSISS